MRTAVVIVMVVLCLTVQAHATLFDRGGGLIYDDVLDVTWLQDANYAKTSGYDEDGLMNWVQAMRWADSLNFYDSVRNTSWDDWRLPATIDGPDSWGNDGTTTIGFNITSGEMGYMYYQNLGNVGYFDIDGNQQENWGLNNTGPFNNLLPDYYWIGTPYSAHSSMAWYFRHYSGYQGYHMQGWNDFYAWAVRDGDVGFAPVPEPTSIILLSTGLLSVVGTRMTSGLRKKAGPH